MRHLTFSSSELGPSARRRITIAISLALGLLLAIGGYLAIDWQERQTQAVAFDYRANSYARILAGRLERHVDSLKAIRHHLELIGMPDRLEFESLARPLLDARSDIASLQWIVPLPRERRARWEARQRDEAGNPLRLRVRNGVGGWRQAPVRSTHMPVLYDVRRTSRVSQLGFDLAANPDRLDVLQRARDSGRPLMSGRLPDVRGDSPFGDVLLVAPVFKTGRTPVSVAQRRSQLAGYVVTVLQIGSLIEAALGGLHDEGGVDFVLSDVSRPNLSEFLYRHIDAPHVGQIAGNALGDRDHWLWPPLQTDRLIDIAGRTWQLRNYPAPGGFGRQVSMAGLAVATALLVVAGLVGLFAVAIQGQASRVRRLVSERTRELERTQQRYKEARDRAEDANRTKSEFLAAMSHEIRTPMNGVLGMAELLLQTDLTSKQFDHVRQIRDSGDTLLQLLNDILDLSKIEAGRVEIETVDFNIGDLLQSVDSVWRSRADSAGIALNLGRDEDVPGFLRSDPTRIRQILFNLISNALKFTHEGAISVNAALQSEHDGLVIRFSVSDTGIGIEPEAVPRLFEKFAQADGSVTRRYGGTGLGLAICRELVTLLGGEIGVETVAGQGSTFWFTIRCEAGNWENAVAADFAPMSVVDETASLPPRHILVVEDNKVNQTVIRSMLDNAGHTCELAENGREAVDAVQAGSYDLVLMDIQMPEMDGVSATKAIRALDGPARYIPIIALTANSMKGDRETYLAAGMNDYVSKPIRPGTLFSAIERCTTTGGRRKSGDAPGAAETAAGGVLDHAELRAMADLVGAAFIGELLDCVATDFASFCRASDKAEGAVDLQEVGRLAHVLKGTFGQFGARTAQATAAAVQQAVRDGRSDEALRLTAILRIEGHEALQALRAWTARETGAPAEAAA